MIYLDFDSQDADEPDERALGRHRFDQDIAREAILARTSELPACGCPHPYAVVAVHSDPGELSFEVCGIRAACCAGQRAILLRALDASRAGV